MEDSHHQEPTCPNNYSDGQVIITGGSSSRNEPVRSRWTPKPEQILILESIFNSGMVNPPKEETIKIRKVLEKFGAVGDANVFYWFQNRRSRSRRRQRQMQAAVCSTLLNNAAAPPLSPQMLPPSQQQLVLMNTTSIASSSSSSNPMITSSHDQHDVRIPSTVNHQGFVNFSGGDVGFSEIDPQNLCSSSIFQPCHALQFHQSGGGGGMDVITVFINGVETEVQRGPLDMKGMFGEDVVLVHSSGIPVPLNHYGFSLHTLQHGESYFLVPRPI